MAGPGGRVAHLHLHTAHSPKDGLGRIDDYIAAAAADSQPAIAVTDHGTLAGTWRFAHAAASAGIKPILGIEAYLAVGNRHHRDTMTVPADTDPDGTHTAGDGRKTKTSEHLTMLAATRAGWRNLMWLQAQAHTPGSYWYKPRMDWALLGSTNPATGRPAAAGLWVGTGCLGGPVAGALARGDDAGADANLARMVDLFGRDRVFVEVMDHAISLERKLIPALTGLAGRFGLPVVATNDAHYVQAGDAHAHDMWLCIGQRNGAKPVTAATPRNQRWAFRGTGYHLRTAAQMRHLFDTQPGTEHAVDNTLLVAESVDENVLGDPTARLPASPCRTGSTLPRPTCTGCCVRGPPPGTAHRCRVTSRPGCGTICRSSPLSGTPTTS